MKKVFIFLMVIIGFGIIANAQDVIIKKDASEIEAKVLEITDIQIKYKNFDFQDGPIRNINLSEVFMIIYQNGKREVFNKPTEINFQNDRAQNSEPLEPKPVEQSKQTFNSNESATNSKKDAQQITQEEECTITSCGLVVTCEDYPKRLTYYEALNAPAGYRLPSIEELECMAKNKSTLRLAANGEYWSSEDAIRDRAYTITMNDGKREKRDRSDKKSVRYIKTSTNTSTSNRQTTSLQQPQEYQNYQSTSSTNTQNDPSQFVLKKKSKIMINTFVLTKGQSNTLCETLVEEFSKLGFCCVSKMIVEDDPTADVIIFVHATPASVTFNFFDKALNEEVYVKSYFFQLSIKGIAKKLVKEVTPFIEK